MFPLQVQCNQEFLHYQIGKSFSNTTRVSYREQYIQVMINKGSVTCLHNIDIKIFVNNLLLKIHLRLSILITIQLLYRAFLNSKFSFSSFTIRKLMIREVMLLAQDYRSEILNPTDSKIHTVFYVILQIMLLCIKIQIT